VAIGAVAVLLTVAATAGLIAFFNARDDAGLARPAGAPGVADPGADDPRLAAGNVVIVVTRPDERGEAERLAEELGAPGEDEVVAEGQAILVEEGDGPLRALAWQRRLEPAGVGDPALRAFAEYWLGRGRGS
jgi:hypothetical protein